jgi:hypothetical protein
MKNLTSKSLRFIPVALGLACCLLAINAKAGVQYWDNNGTSTPSGGVWDLTSSDWAASSTLTATPGVWNPANAAVFAAGGTSAGNITVNVNTANLGIAGVFNNGIAGTSCNLTLGGTGSLSLNAGDDAFYVSSGKYTIVNTVLTGTGIVDAESTGSLYLNGVNSYSGGTYLGNNGNTLLYFNNSSAFGSGGITLNRTANYSTLLNNSGASATLANNFSINAVNTGASTGINFASSASSPVVSSGTWSLGTVNLVLKNSGGSTAPLTLSGAISGSGGLTVTANAAGSKVILSAASPGYTGATTVAGTGFSFGGTASGAAGYLQFGIANAIPNTTGMTLAGGTMDPGGFNQAMSSATLNLTASSTIDFTSGAAILNFANSSGVAWTSGMTLNLKSTGGGNWNLSGDALEVGTDATGLTAAQLAEITFNGTDVGDAGINAQGYVYDTFQPIPEPSTLVLGLLGGLSVMWTYRRRTV